MYSIHDNIIHMHAVRVLRSETLRTTLRFQAGERARGGASGSLPCQGAGEQTDPQQHAVSNYVGCDQASSSTSPGGFQYAVVVLVSTSWPS